MLLEDIGRRVEWTDFIAEGRGSMHGNGDARNIHEFKWPHSDTERLFGSLFNGWNIGETFFEHAGGLIQERNKEAIYGKPGCVFDDNRCFAVKLGRQ